MNRGDAEVDSQIQMVTCLTITLSLWEFCMENSSDTLQTVQSKKISNDQELFLRTSLFHMFYRQRQCYVFTHDNSHVITIFSRVAYKRDTDVSINTH